MLELEKNYAHLAKLSFSAGKFPSRYKTASVQEKGA